MSEHEIIIAGGGPTGLMLAGELALAGVDVAIVERRTTMEVPGRRAGGLHARSLEVLDQRGIVDRFLAEGQAHPNVGFHVALDISDFPTRHNYLLALRQERIERLLADWVEELGVPIFRGRDVVGVAEVEGGVEVSTAQGVNMRAGWLVGCDGGRSTVRKSAGIDFPGWEASTSWLIAEVRMKEQPVLGFRETASGRHAMAMLDDGERVGVVLAGQDPRATGVPTLDELAAALEAAYGTDFGVHAPGSMSRFSDAARQAAAYRKGRILLAGDAAHIHSPMGGQGLNLGVQDAVNLGWKLARVVTRQSPETLLDTYQAERHPVAARVLRNTIAQSVLRYPGERIAVLGDLVSELLAMEEPRRRFAAMMSGLDIRYGADEGHPLLGRRMPDLDIVVAGKPMRLFTLLHDALPVLLYSSKPLAIDIAQFQEKCVTVFRPELRKNKELERFRVSVKNGNALGADRVKSVEATFEGVCELPAVGVVDMPATVLIRPDGHVAWVGEEDPEGLSDVLGTWFGD